MIANLQTDYEKRKSEEEQQLKEHLLSLTQSISDKSCKEKELSDKILELRLGRNLN